MVRRGVVPLEQPPPAESSANNADSRTTIDRDLCSARGALIAAWVRSERYTSAAATATTTYTRNDNRSTRATSHPYVSASFSGNGEASAPRATAKAAAVL